MARAGPAPLRAELGGASARTLVAETALRASPRLELRCYWFKEVEQVVVELRACGREQWRGGNDVFHQWSSSDGATAVFHHGESERVNREMRE